MKKIITLIFSLTLCFSLMTGIASAAPQAEFEGVRVTGSADTEVAPDMATIRGSLQAKAATAENARELLAKKIKNLRNAMYLQNVSKEALITTNYSLYPEYNYNNGKSKIEGYTARADFNITANDLNRLSEVLDKAIAADFQVDAVNFGLKDKDALEAGLLAQAVKNARMRANIVANAGGRTLGKLYNADLRDTNSYNVRPLARAAYMSSPNKESMDTATHLNPGLLTLKVKVDAEFAFAD